MESERRLAAIMFTDMVGFTSLAQGNEPLTLELLEEHRKLLRPLFPRYFGKEIKTEGDKFLVEFASALDAIRCALDIQKTLHESNSGRPPEKRVILRIGVHLGDVIHTKDRDVYGDAVNVASRIEPLADPGGICVSDSVYTQIKNKFEYPFVNIGSKQLKNVQEPMEVWRVVLPWKREEVASRATISDRNRLVVLPFKSMSPDPSDEYFADGMTEELITALSGIRGLDVIARTTAMHYKGDSKRVSDIGKELSCRSLIEGSVRKSGNRVRISVQLVTAQDESHIWAQNYDKQLDDIFAVQSDIAKRVARALKVKLFAAEEQVLDKRTAPIAGAYTLYLKGMYLWNKRSKETINRAIDCFGRAIEIDPSFAPGFSGLAGCHFSKALFYSEDRDTDYKMARTFVLKALEVDDNLAEAHATLAQVVWRIDYDVKRAEEEIRKAIELKPSYIFAHVLYVLFLLFQQRTENAYKELERVVDLDPLSHWAAIVLGAYSYSVREYDKAIEHFKKGLQVEPNNVAIRFFLFRIFCLRHRDFSILPTISPEETMLGLTMMHAFTGNIQEARSLLSSLEEQHDSYLRRQPYFVGIVYFKLNEIDKGFEWLEKAVDEHDPAITFFLTNSEELDGVSSDPRYHALLRKVNLE